MVAERSCHEDADAEEHADAPGEHPLLEAGREAGDQRDHTRSPRGQSSPGMASLGGLYN